MLFRQRSTAYIFPFFICALLLIISFAHAGGGKPSQYPVAMRSFGVWEPGTGERFDFSVWYPGGNNFLEDIRIKDGWEVSHNRPGRIIPGFYPVILVSHDAAGSRYANNDLASFLASGGFIVIVPTHNGDSQNNGSAMYTAQIFRDRPRQMLRALETLLENPDFTYFMDESRIGVLGIGFGSVTALQLAGASPDISYIDDYCSQDRSRDAFCGGWPLQRLRRATQDMPILERREGKRLFAPPLTLYAPRLTQAKLSKEVIALFEKQKEPEKNNPQTVWHYLFGEDPEENAPAEKENGAETGTSASDMADPFPLEMDFQGGPLFGSAVAGSANIQPPAPDSSEFRAGAEEAPANIPDSAVAPEAVSDTSTVFRRPPDTRRIRGVALMSPAGGMLFTPEQLHPVRVPVVMVQAGKNILYPPAGHAQPYYAGLPAPPQVLRLDEADHFSLFARCSDESKDVLSEQCGRTKEDQREKNLRERNTFLLNFFQTSVGLPLAPALPPGFVAIPKPQPQGNRE